MDVVNRQLSDVPVYPIIVMFSLVLTYPNGPLRRSVPCMGCSQSEAP